MRTVGALTVEPGRYVVQAEPHVTIRLKRVFGKLGRAASEKYFLSDTEENATELLWFMERFPLDVDEAGRAHLERRAAAQRQREDEIEAMIAGASAPPEFELAVPPPPETPDELADALESIEDATRKAEGGA